MLAPLVLPYGAGSCRVSFVSHSSSCNIIFSIILPPIGVLDIGLRSLRDRGGFSFGMGTISEILKASGNIPVLIAQFVMSEKGSAKKIANSCSICFGKSLGPVDFFAKLVIYIYIYIY